MISSFAILGFSLAGCGTSSDQEPPSMHLEPPTVSTFGAMRAIMHEGDTSPKVELGTLLRAGQAGVGALSGLRGEVTFDGSTLWISRPDGDAIATERFAPDAHVDESATLLVSAEVQQWTEVTLAEPAGLAELGARVASASRAVGLPAGPTPFRVEGELVDLRYHVIDGSKLPEGPSSHAAHKASGVVVSHERVAATLVGFWSTEHAGVFTHMGETVHVHVTVAEPLGSGHVDAVTIPAGATLWLPSVTTTQEKGQ